MYQAQKNYYKKNQEALKTKARNAYHEKKRAGSFFSISFSEEGYSPFSSTGYSPFTSPLPKSIIN